MRPNTSSRAPRAVLVGAVALAVGTMIPAAAQAGRRANCGPVPTRAMEEMSKQLDLSAEQQERVREILQSSAEKRQETRAAHRSELGVLRQETDDELSQVLTQAQLQELNRLREARRERPRDRDRAMWRWDPSEEPGN